MHNATLVMIKNTLNYKYTIENALNSVIASQFLLLGGQGDDIFILILLQENSWTRIAK